MEQPPSPWTASSRRPAAAVPEGACDCHTHVFGPRARFPLIPRPKYEPPAHSWIEDHRRLHDRLGIGRSVLVQPSPYGTDHRAMLAALDALGPRVRGVAVFAPDVAEAELDRLARSRVVGVRINAGHGLPLSALEPLAERIAPRRWHIQLFFAHAQQLIDLAPRLRRLPVPTVIDHMARVPTDGGTDDPAFRTLMALVADGVCWVKISWAETLSRARGDFTDVDPMAKALIAANPERVVWGSDWPHTSAPKPLPDDAELLDLVGRWAPDPTTRRRILVENPAALYGF